MKFKYILFILIFLVLLGSGFIFFRKDKKENTVYEFSDIENFKLENLNRYKLYKSKNNNLSNQDIVTRVNIGLDYDFYGYVSDTDTSLDTLMLTNKYLKLDKDYMPSDLEEIDSQYFINGNKNARLLRREAKINFEKLSQDSILNNTPVYGQSAYRAYNRQEYLFNKAIQDYGYDNAINDTAKPGHSEHQTGLTIDVSSNKNGNMLNFDETSSFKWMLDNAYKYGFILRYPEGKSDITGFIYEAWHYRYVGVKVATDMHNNYKDLTYEEYYYRFIDK